MKELISLKEKLDSVYEERNKIAIAFANSLRQFPRSFNICRAKHDPNDREWEDDWRNILVIEYRHKDKGLVQLTWHFHDSKAHLLEDLDLKLDYKWDGHTTEEKYKHIIEDFKPGAGVIL